LGRKLFVGRLSWDTTDDTLAGAFREFGEVEEAKVVMDRDTGRSKGFGFVTMDTQEAADVAMGALNDSRLDGRSIAVTEANERRSDRADNTSSSSDRSSGPVEVIVRRARGRTRDDGAGGSRPPLKG